MIRRLSLLFTLCCLSWFSRAGTVSGVVTNASLSAPAANQFVILYDSTSSLGYIPRDSMFTNSSGAYSFTVSSSITSGNLLIMTTACGKQYLTASRPYSGSNLTINLTVCQPITVTGTVSYPGPVAAASVKVYLDDSGASPLVRYRDSTVTNATGQYSFTVPATVTFYYMYAYACGTSWYTAHYYTVSGNTVVNMALTCPASTITSTVVNSTSGLPVWGQKVYFVDSTATSWRLDSAVTNTSGKVSFSLPPTAPSGTRRMFTNACGVQSQTFTYSGSSMTGPTFSICLGNSVISGTVTNATASAPAVSHLVRIIDSLGSTQLSSDSVYTNTSGFYSLILPLNKTTGSKITAATQGCGYRYTNSGTYSGSNMTLNLSICSSSIATASGTVNMYGTGTPLTGRMVYLADTSIIGGGIRYIDSVVTNSVGAYNMVIPASISTGYLMVGTRSCGGLMVWANMIYRGYNLVRNFTVCNTTGLTTISGTIVKPSGAPIAGATVTINSSITTTTNSSGGYSLTIPPSFPLGGSIAWSASYSCGTRSLSITNMGSNIIRQDTIYTNWCYSIGGKVTKQGGGAAASAKVYLIGEIYDTTRTPIDTLLIALDSTLTNASGVYSFNQKSYSTQRIKAALQPSDPSYWNYLPTYHDSALTWSNATTIALSSWFSNDSNVNVSLRAGTNPGGPGFIGGRVVLGANKQTGVGDPLAQRILLLTTASDVAVAYTYSDGTGAFSFPSLPYGTYKLFGDAGGKLNPPLLITLSASAASVTSVIFEENSQKFEGRLGAVGVATQKSDAVHLYPNPAGAYITLNGLNSVSGSKNIVVRNVAGAVVYTSEIASEDVITLSTENLPAGMYLLQLQSASGVRNFRFAKN